MINLTEIENSNKYVNLLKKVSYAQDDICVLMGAIVLFIYSKDIFPSNKELPEFVLHTLGLEYKSYVFKVRTTLVAKYSRYLYLCTENERSAIRKNFIDYFIIDNEIINNKKTKNENDKLTKWLKG